VHAVARNRPSRGDLVRGDGVSKGMPLGDVVQYLSEAFSQIFRPVGSDVPWYSEPFEGKIVHHEDDIGRMRGMHPGGPAQPVPIMVEGQGRGGETNYVVDSIGRLLGKNVSTHSQEPKKFYSTGYRGKAYSQRRLRKQYDRLSRY